jgi:HPr kinase/phosphorylase
MSTIHGSAVLMGARALLIRGPAGAGKSRLVLDVLEAGASGRVFTRLVADDRAHISVLNGRVLVQPAQNLAGLLEIRGLGIRRLPYEPLAVVGLVIDLGGEPARLPDEADAQTSIGGVTLPRMVFPSCAAALPVLLAALGRTTAGGDSDSPIYCAVHHYP